MHTLVDALAFVDTRLLCMRVCQVKLGSITQSISILVFPLLCLIVCLYAINYSTTRLFTHFYSNNKNPFQQKNEFPFFPLQQGHNASANNTPDHHQWKSPFCDE